MMTLEKFEEASELVKKVTNPTKLVFSEYLSTQTGAKVYLKPENMQHTGAYKMIDQGSSELNIIVGVTEEDFEQAIRCVYDMFVKSASE